jgi:hypothetical protein
MAKQQQRTIVRRTGGRRRSLVRVNRLRLALAFAAVVIAPAAILFILWLVRVLPAMLSGCFAAP